MTHAVTTTPAPLVTREALDHGELLHGALDRRTFERPRVHTPARNPVVEEWIERAERHWRMAARSRNAEHAHPGGAGPRRPAAGVPAPLVREPGGGGASGGGLMEGPGSIREGRQNRPIVRDQRHPQLSGCGDELTVA